MKTSGRILTPAGVDEIAALRERFGVTQLAIARATRGRNRNHGVHRSLVSKVLGGHAVSRHVLRETYKALVAAGWRPRGRPAWLPDTVREIARAVAALAVVTGWGTLMSLLVG